ncbi:hypothetical protein GCM10027610_118230 [Dactylosporangium cerinum]
MTQEDAGRVFERFYRTDPSRTRALGGSGLGLSIVNALVTAHGERSPCAPRRERVPPSASPSHSPSFHDPEDPVYPGVCKVFRIMRTAYGCVQVWAPVPLQS